MTLETMTKIATWTSDGTSNTGVFANIPQGYTDLVIRFSVRSQNTGSSSYDSIGLYPNYNYGPYTKKHLLGDGTNVVSGTSQYRDISIVPSSTTASWTAGSYTNTEVYISNYTSNFYKIVNSNAGAGNNATTLVVNGIGYYAMVWDTTLPITTISFDNATSGANYVAGSTVTLYGIKAMRHVMPLTNWASGGTITTDGTYVYHTFTSSNMFVANSNLTNVEILSIAGGGGANQYGGGGGGGILYSANQSLIGSYPIVVGAGGRGGYITGNPASAGAFDPSNGTDSFFGSLTHAIGGGGAGSGWTGVGNGTAAKSGGSGGGGSARYTVGGASSQDTGGTSIQTSLGGVGYGNSGGNGSALTGTASQLNGGGGGGAGAAGSNASSSASGAGGAGTSVFSTWGLATSTGQNSGGTYYYAGGGGGYCNTSSTVASGGVGGGGGGSTGISGTISTGGGAGAGNVVSSYYASGGSGVVIVRYKA
jgi:hypothetical protein